MIEFKILAVLCSSRETYEQLIPVIEFNDFSDLGQLILTEINTFYEIDPSADSVDLEILLARLSRSYPKQTELFKTHIKTFDSVSLPNALTEYVNLRIYSLENQLGSALMNHEGSKIPALTEIYNNLLERREAALVDDAITEEEVYIGGDIEDILAPYKAENLIKIYPKILNEALGGGVPPGTWIILFGRPEVGKSMFSINMAAKFIEQGHTAMYVINEDPASAIRTRFISRLSGMSLEEMKADPQRAKAIADERGFNNLILNEMAPGSLIKIERYVDKYRPDILIVDQLRNVQSSKNLTRVESLEHIAQSLRNITKKYKMVGIGVTQAGDSAEGKKVLTMGDVDFSNTGIPGTADIMIGVGNDSATESVGQRVLSLPKNKLSGNHSAFSVKVVPHLSKVTTI